MAQIDNIFDPWEGHTHAEVEEALKAEIAQLRGGNYTQIAVSIVGSLNRTFVATAENVTFRYKVNSTVDGTYNPDFNVEITIGNSVITINNVHASDADTEIETPNLAPYLAQIGNDVITVKIRAYNSTGDTSSVKSLKFNRQSATISTTNTIREKDPRTLQFYAQFTGRTAELHVEFYGTTGSASETSFTQIINTLESAGSTNVSVPSLDAGAHIVKAYLLLEDGETRSAILTTSIFVTTGYQQDDVYITYDEIVNAVEKNYYDIRFCVLDPDLPDTAKVIVILSEKDPVENKWIIKGQREVTNRSVEHWQYLVPRTSNQVQIAVPFVDEEGNIQYTGNNNIRTRNTLEIQFDAEPSGINWAIKSGAELHLSAQNRTNNDTNKDKWTSNGYNVEFENVQFDENTGWVDQNHLHLVGTARARIKNFFPFYNETEFERGSVGGGILSTGMTIICSFAVSGVSDANKRVIDCYSDEDNIGFYVTGDSIYIGVGANLLSRPDEVSSATNHNSRRFSANTKIDLTIAVQPYYENGEVTKHEARYYINGEIAGFGIIPNQKLTQLLSNRTEVVFGGDGAALDVYDFLYYPEYLEAFDILQTRTMILDNVATMSAIFNKNKYYDLDNGKPKITLKQAIAYGKYLAKQRCKVPGEVIPFAVVVCTDFCNDVSLVGNNIIEGGYKGSTSATNSIDRQDLYIYRFTIDEDGNGIISADNTFWYEGDTPGSLRGRRQGTSTKDSTKGNTRWDSRGGVKLHRFDAGSQTFSSDYTTIAKNGDMFYIPNKDAIPCYLLTMKKNPNESTHARNLPTAKFVEDCHRHMATVAVNGEYIYEDCLTPPQRRELASIIEHYPNKTRQEQVSMIKTRQCVDGIPSIAFEILRTNNSSILRDPTSNAATTAFSGQFDLITDKTNMKVFGFGGYWTVNADGSREWHADEVDETFSVEWRDNASAICNFHTYDISNGGNYKADGSDGLAHLEYRYPDKGAVCGDVVPTGKDATNRGLETTGPIQRLMDFVYNCSEYNIGTQVIDGHIDAGYNSKITINGVQVTDNKPNRLDKFKQELKYYCVVNEIILNGIIIDDGAMCDQDTKNQFWSWFAGQIDIIEDNNGVARKLLRLLGYDFDSGWGVDNDNFFKFLYTLMYSDGLYDGKHAGRGPDFWPLVYACFKDEMKAMRNELFKANLLTSEGILKYMHENQIDMYNAMIYNANSEYSYTSISSDYQKAHGSAKEHNEWFVKGRMYLKGGEAYQFNGAASDFSTDNVQFNLTAYENIVDKGNKYWNQRGNGLTGLGIRVTAWERTYVYYSANNTLFGGGFIDVEDVVDNNVIVDRVSPMLTLQSNNPDERSTGSDYRVGIRGCKHIRTISDLSPLYISSIYTGWGQLANIEELNIGKFGKVEDENGVLYDYNNPYLTDLNTTGVKFGCCKKLNIAGLTGLSGTLNLTNFPVLTHLDARNDVNVEEIILPSTDDMQELLLPANLTNLTLTNKVNLSNIEMQGETNTQGMQNIRTLTVNNSNNYTAVFGIEEVYNLLNNQEV